MSSSRAAHHSWRLSSIMTKIINFRLAPATLSSGEEQDVPEVLTPTKIRTSQAGRAAQDWAGAEALLLNINTPVVGNNAKIVKTSGPDKNAAVPKEGRL